MSECSKLVESFQKSDWTSINSANHGIKNLEEKRHSIEASKEFLTSAEFQKRQTEYVKNHEQLKMLKNYQNIAKFLNNLNLLNTAMISPCSFTPTLLHTKESVIKPTNLYLINMNKLKEKLFDAQTCFVISSINKIESIVESKKDQLQLTFENESFK